MAKALKIAAFVVGGVALAFTGIGLAAGLGAAATSFGIGVSASTLFLGAAALEVGASLLAKKGSTTASQLDRLTTTIDPRTPRKSVYGHTAFANDLRYEEWFGADQEYCAWIIALASHRITSLDEIWINQDQVWTATGGVAAKYQGYFFVQHVVTEGSPSNTVSVSSANKWNTSSRLTGCAYVHLQFRVTGTTSKATSPFSGGVPSRITLIGKGSPVYDPRRDGTVPGGSGSMRASDQSTWSYLAGDGTDLGSNIPLQILRELLGWRIANPSTGALKLAVGGGLPPRRIDMASFIVAANIADELAAINAGGTEPKFHGGACVSEADDLHARLDMLCAACNGRLRDVNGKLALVIMHNDLAGAAADDGLTDDDVIGAFTWESDPPLDQAINVVRGRYTDPSSASLFQMIDYPEVRIASPDGIDRIMTLDLSVVQSPSMAQRIAKQVLQRRQYQRTFSAPFDIRAWQYQVGDVVPLTFSALSFDRRLLRVTAQELGQDGQCVMSLIDENAAIYAWDASDAAPVQAADPIVYDPTKSPLVLAIADAGTTAGWGGVVDDNGKKPEDNATNSADPTSAFGPDQTVEEVLASATDLLNTATSLLSAAVNQQVANQRQAARTARQTYIDGATMGATVRNEISKSNDLIESVNLIGVKAPDKSAFIINADSVRLSPTESFAQRFTSISASLGTSQAALDTLTTAQATETSARITQYTGLTARVANAEGNVSYLYTATSNETSARSFAISNLTATVTANQSSFNASISSLQQADANETSARALAITGVNARVDTLTSSTNATFTSLQQADATETSARIQNVSNLLATIGSLGSDLTATKASVTTVSNALATETQARADLATTVNATLGSQSASISYLNSVVTTPSGAAATAMMQLDANGHFVGYKATNNGSTGSIAFSFDSFNVVMPDGSPLLIASGGQVYMPTVRISKLTVGAMDPEFLMRQVSFDGSEGTQSLPGGIIMKWGRYRGTISSETSMSILFKTPFPSSCDAFVPVPYIGSFSDARDLWLQNVGNPGTQGATVATQAATSNNQSLDGFDWLAFGR